MHCTMSISTHVYACAIDHVEPEAEIKRSKSKGCSKVHKRQVVMMLTLL
jgi:hypothetical protein